MIEAEKALGLITELINVEVKSTKQENFRKSGISKTTKTREQRAIQALFVALTGRKATDAEINQLRI